MKTHTMRKKGVPVYRDALSFSTLYSMYSQAVW